jgi:glycine oxidase
MAERPTTSLRPVWFEELDPADAAALDPGPGGMLERPDVLVVGGGVVGVATAVECLRAELGRVLLIERATLAAGASSGAAGLLTPEAHVGVDPDPFVELARAGYDRWRTLQDEIDGGVGVVDLDWISLEQALFAGDVRPLPPGAEELSAAEIGSLLPALASPVPGFRLRQARVNPVLAIARLIRAAGGGLGVATGVTALSVGVAGDRVTSVSTTGGQITPGAVVFATGQPPDVDALGLALPSELVKGHMILTGPVGTPWPGSVAPLGTDIGGGRLLIGGSLDVGDPTPEVRWDMVEAMRSFVESFLVPLPVPPVTNAWCCFRPAHPDRIPVIDRVPGFTNAWLASGHYRTGIVMAPASGALLARWIGSGRRPTLAEHFSASRFG